jgi:hypothetical protein
LKIKNKIDAKRGENKGKIIGKREQKLTIYW